MNLTTAFLNTLSSGTPTNPVSNSVDVIVSAGQSNIDGRNPLIDAPVWLNQADPTISNVFVWDVSKSQFNKFKLGVNTGQAVNTSVTWAYDMIFYKLYADFLATPLYVIKRTQGGTPIFIDPANPKGSWNIDFASIPQGIPKLTQELEVRYNNAKNYLQNFNKTLNVKAILWYQGGTDVQTQGALAVYKDNFRDLINYFRNTIIQDPNVPFVFVTQSLESQTYHITLQTAQEELAVEMSNVYLVDASWATLYEDRLHLDSQSSIQLGQDNFDLISTF